MAVRFAFKRNDKVYFVSDIKFISDNDLTEYHDYSVLQLTNDILVGCENAGNVTRIIFDLLKEWITEIDEELTKEVIVTKIVNPLNKYLIEKDLLDENSRLGQSIYIMNKNKLFQVFGNFYVVEVENFCSGGYYESIVFATMYEQYKSDIKDIDLITNTTKRLSEVIIEITNEFMVFEGTNKTYVLSEVIK